VDLLCSIWRVKEAEELDKVGLDMVKVWLDEQYLSLHKQCGGSESGLSRHFCFLPRF